jgi:hypothetical protein
MGREMLLLRKLGPSLPLRMTLLRLTALSMTVPIVTLRAAQIHFSGFAMLTPASSGFLPILEESGAGPSSVLDVGGKQMRRLWWRVG